MKETTTARETDRFTRQETLALLGVLDVRYSGIQFVLEYEPPRWSYSAGRRIPACWTARVWIDGVVQPAWRVGESEPEAVAKVLRLHPYAVRVA